MNSRTFILVLLGLFYLTVFVTANADTALEISMKHMSKAYKELSLDLQQPHDIYKSDYLALADTLKTEAQTARGLVPKKAGTLPIDQQDVMEKAYQKSMDDLIQAIESLTQDIQNSQWDDARKAMGNLKQQMINGHRAFRIKQ